MLTGISTLECDICNSRFVSAATGNSHPYNDHICIKCGWKGTICDSCAMKKCPECNGKLKSTHEKLSDALGGNVIF